MPRGGFRPHAGRPSRNGGPSEAFTKADAVREAKKAGLTPLEYMLQVINDPDADTLRRDRLAVAAAPYCHPKIAEARAGKKDQQAEAAASAGQGSEWSRDLEFDGQHPN